LKFSGGIDRPSERKSSSRSSDGLKEVAIIMEGREDNEMPKDKIKRV